MDEKLQWLLGEIKSQEEVEENLKQSSSEGDRLLYCLRFDQPKTRKDGSISKGRCLSS